jgi:cytochrome c5
MASPSPKLAAALSLAGAALFGGILVALGGPPTTTATAPAEAPAPAVVAAEAPEAVPAAASSEPQVDEASGLIMAAGWELVASQCAACHSLKIVTQNRGDEGYWLGLIRWMQATQNLWPFAPEVEQSIVAYLGTNYGAVGFGRRPPLAAHLLPPDEAAAR